MGLNVCILGETFFNLRAFIWAYRLEEAFEPIELEACQIFLLPFIDPIDARIYYKDDENKEIQGIGDALAYILQDIENPLILTRPIFWWRILRFLRRMIVMVKVYGIDVVWN